MPSKIDFVCGYTYRSLLLGTSFRNFNQNDLESRNISKINTTILTNLSILNRILEWNVEKGFGLFRVPSNIISHINSNIVQEMIYNGDLFEDSEVKNLLQKIRKTGIKISLHPNTNLSLSNKDKELREFSLRNLKTQLKLAEILGCTEVVLHINAKGKCKKECLDEFKDVLVYNLSETELNRLVLENDENNYNVVDVVTTADELKCGWVLDIHHHILNTVDDKLLLDILKTNQPRKIHLSSPAKNPRDREHSFFVNCSYLKYLESLLNACSIEQINLMFESKGKDISIIDVMTRKEGFIWNYSGMSMIADEYIRRATI